ncbi:hypothetical protein [Heliomicrobium gestii]|nr:hypothetical protein [Heliomicrobium gestii]MBM7866927.1 hypothetical protein [Heliomicrobium gestii]
MGCSNVGFFGSGFGVVAGLVIALIIIGAFYPSIVGFGYSGD